MEDAKKGIRDPESKKVDPQEKKVEGLAALKQKAGEKKRPRGRPKGSTKKKEEEAPEPEAPPISSLLDTGSTKALLEWVFGTVAQRAGPWWVLKPEESEAGAKVINSLIAKYSPAFVKYAEEMAALVWAIGVVGPRYQKTMAAQVAMAEQEAAQERGEESLADSFAPGSGGDGGDHATK